MPLNSPLTRVKLAFTLAAMACLLGQTRLAAGPGYTPVRDVADGIINPFATELNWFAGTSGGFNETASYTVPAGKHLEITEISCDAYALSSTSVLMKITVTCGGTTITHYLTNFAASTVTPNYWMMSMTSHHLYVDAGSTITVDVIRQTPPPTNSAYFTDVLFSGRMTSF